MFSRGVEWLPEIQYATDAVCARPAITRQFQTSPVSGYGQLDARGGQLGDLTSWVDRWGWLHDSVARLLDCSRI